MAAARASQGGLRWEKQESLFHTRSVKLALKRDNRP